MNTGDLHIACIQQSWKQTIYLSVSNPVIPSKFSYCLYPMPLIQSIDFIKTER